MCPDCGSKQVKINGTEVYCEKCGLVISDIQLSEMVA